MSHWPKGRCVAKHRFKEYMDSTSCGKNGKIIARAWHAIWCFPFTEGERTLLGGKFSTYRKEIQIQAARQKGRMFIIVFPGTARQDQPRCRGASLDWNPAVTRAQRDWEEQAEYPYGCREPQIVTAGLLDQGGPEEKQVSSQHEGCPWSAPVSGRQMGLEQSPSTLKGACLEDAWERGRARSPAHSCQAKASIGWLMARCVLVLQETATTQ